MRWVELYLLRITPISIWNAMRRGKYCFQLTFKRVAFKNCVQMRFKTFLAASQCVSYRKRIWTHHKTVFRVSTRRFCVSCLHGSQDRDFLFFSRNVWIPEGARCCTGHLVNHELSKEAIAQIKPLSVRYQELSSSDVQLLLNTAQNLFENEKKRFSFDDPRDLSEADYSLLTNLSRANFEDLAQTISLSTIRSSCNRSIRTALGIHLCKLRLVISNRMLACMFQIEDKRTVTRIINSARQAIIQTFVPNNLGFGHITRQHVIDHHTTQLT